MGTVGQPIGPTLVGARDPCPLPSNVPSGLGMQEPSPALVQARPKGAEELTSSGLALPSRDGSVLFLPSWTALCHFLGLLGRSVGCPTGRQRGGHQAHTSELACSRPASVACPPGTTCSVTFLHAALSWALLGGHPSRGTARVREVKTWA